MDDQVTPTPMSPSQTPVIAPNKPGFPLWGIALMAVLIGFGGLLTWRTLSSQAIPVAPTPSPTITPTPTPVRLPSDIASQSAFLSLQTEVASLSATVQGFIVDDPSLSPPVLDLPLGL